MGCTRRTRKRVLVMDVVPLVLGEPGRPTKTLNAQLFINALKSPTLRSSVGSLDFTHAIDPAGHVRLVAAERMSCSDEELLAWIVRRDSHCFATDWLARVGETSFEPLTQEGLQRHINVAETECRASTHLSTPLPFPISYVNSEGCDNAWELRNFSPHQSGASCPVFWYSGERCFYLETKFDS